MANMKDSQRKAMMARINNRDPFKIRSKNPRERGNLIFQGMKLNLFNMQTAQKMTDRELRVKVSDRIAMKIVKEKEKRLKGLTEPEKELVEDNTESDIRQELKDKGFDA